MGDFQHAKSTRREIIKKAAYVTPAILTMTASPAFAARGSNGGGGEKDDKKNKKDKKG
jgi:hypothetical protein